METKKNNNYQRTQLPTYMDDCQGYGVDENGEPTHAEGCPGYWMSYEFEKKRKSRSDECQKVFNQKGKSGSGSQSKIRKRIEKQWVSINTARQIAETNSRLTPEDREWNLKLADEMEADMRESMAEIGMTDDDLPALDEAATE